MTPMSLAARSFAIRALGAVLVALAAFATVALVARAQAPEGPPAGTPEGIVITIQPPSNGKPAEIPLADLGDGDINTPYKLAQPNGAPPKTVNVKGPSVLAVLKASQTNFNYSRIDIAKPDGSTLTITKDQIQSVRPPLFYTDDQGVTHFIGSPGADGVVPLEAQFAVSGPITLTQLPPPRLNIVLSPKKKKIKLGGSVSFSARVTGARAGETVRYEWAISGTDNGRKFDRWGAVGQDSATHTEKFPRKDRLYKVRVAAWVDGDREGSVVAVSEITVGNPDLESGKKKNGETGPDDTGSTGGTGGTGTGGYDGGDYGGGDGGYSGGYTPSYTPPAYTPPAPAPTPPPPEPVDPPELPDIATSDATTVEGNLLADASDPPPTSLLESAAKAANNGKPSESAGGAGVPEAAISIAGVLALLGLGAGLEFREGKLPRLRVPRLPLPRRGA